MQTGEKSPTVNDEFTGELFDLTFTGQQPAQPVATEAPVVQLHNESFEPDLSRPVPLTSPPSLADSPKIIIASDTPEVTNGFIVDVDDNASAPARGSQLFGRLRGLLGRSAPRYDIYDAFDDQQAAPSSSINGQIDPLLHPQGRGLQVNTEASLADLGSGVNFQGHDALNKAMSLAAEARQRELDLRKVDCQMEIDTHLHLLEDIKTLEARAQSVFAPSEVDLPVISYMCEVIVDRARQIIDTQVNLDGLADISFDDDPAAWSNPGRAILERLLTGQVDGVDKGLVEKVASVAVDYANQLHGSKQLKYKDRQALKNPIKALDFLSKEDSWEVLNAAVAGHAKEASTKAHGTLFKHITMLNDYSAEHRAQQFPDEAQPPHIMERDFNSLTKALGIENSSWQQIQDGSYVAGINIPYEPGDNNPLDLIKRRAGNKMRSIDTPGYSSFVALVEAPMPGGDSERWLILGSHPLITADSAPEIPATAPRNKFLTRNTRQTPHTSNGNVIQMPLSVFQLTPRSYVALTEVIQDYGRPFADFRHPISQSRKNLIESVRLKTELLKRVEMAKQGAAGKFDDIGNAIAISSSEVDRQLIDSSLGRVQHELTGAVQTVVPIAELGPWQPPTTTPVDLAPPAPGTVNEIIIDADIVEASNQTATRARYSDQATQELRIIDLDDIDEASQSISFI